MGSSSILRRAAELSAAAVAGGAVVLGGVALFGGLDGHTTTVRELVSIPGGVPTSFVKGHALSINQIYNRFAPGVVQVSTTSVVNVNPTDPFGLPVPGFQQQETQKALGSGFVIDKAGHVITNYHVVQGAKTVKVNFSSNENDTAHVIGTDPSTDIAVLQIDAHSRALTPLPWGNSDSVQVGDSVVAIGN